VSNNPQQLRDRGVDLVVLDQPVDTTTAAGRLFFTLIAAFAEFERDLITERTKDGLEAARAQGRRGGRPAALTPEQKRHARQLAADGRPVAEVARLLGCPRQSVYRAMQAA
jgi:DNA invertase Pin-like site-specific DNA recombinase